MAAEGSTKRRLCGVLNERERGTSHRPEVVFCCCLSRQEVPRNESGRANAVLTGCPGGIVLLVCGVEMRLQSIHVCSMVVL